MEETEKRFLGAIAISFVVLMLWAQFFGPSPAPPEPVPESAASAAAPIEPAPTVSLPESTPPTAAIVATDPSDTLVATDLFELTLTNRGGRASSWKLRGYTDDAGNSVELIPPDSHQLDRLPLSLWLPGREELSGSPIWPRGASRSKVTTSRGGYRLRTRRWAASPSSRRRGPRWFLLRRGDGRRGRARGAMARLGRGFGEAEGHPGGEDASPG
jgi:hypothetical protein